MGFIGCSTFGPTSLTSDHVIAHLPSIPRSIRIKRSKDSSDFIPSLSILFIVDKTFAPRSSLYPRVLTLQVSWFLQLRSNKSFAPSCSLCHRIIFLQVLRLKSNKIFTPTNADLFFPSTPPPLVFFYFLATTDA